MQELPESVIEMVEAVYAVLKKRGEEKRSSGDLLQLLPIIPKKLS
jgi:hypothetical protein